MADDELDLDVKEKSGKGKLILLVVGVLLLVGIAVGVTLYFTGALGGGDKKEEAKTEVADENQFEAKPTLYLPLRPEFVVNFEDTSIVSYMQIEMELMAREQSALDAVSQHMPVIRNNILILLSTQKYEEINSMPGKEKLREEVLATIQQVINEEFKSQGAETKEGEQAAEAVEPPKVEAVYFTSLIMQ